MDELAAELAVAERDAAFGQRKEGVVLAHADIVARIIFGAALAHDDVAGEDSLAAELLHAEPLALRVATVARRTACFLMCHDVNLTSSLFIRSYQPTASLSKPSSSACWSARSRSAPTWPARPTSQGRRPWPLRRRLRRRSGQAFSPWRPWVSPPRPAPCRQQQVPRPPEPPGRPERAPEPRHRPSWPR